MYRYRGYKIIREEISDRSGEIIMMVRPSMSKDLGLIKNIAGATFIYSLWEGYLQDDSLQKMMRFIYLFDRAGGIVVYCRYIH